VPDGAAELHVLPAVLGRRGARGVREHVVPEDVGRLGPRLVPQVVRARDEASRPRPPRSAATPVPVPGPRRRARRRDAGAAGPDAAERGLPHVGLQVERRPHAPTPHEALHLRRGAVAERAPGGGGGAAAAARTAAVRPLARRHARERVLHAGGRQRRRAGVALRRFSRYFCSGLVGDGTLERLGLLVF